MNPEGQASYQDDQSGTEALRQQVDSVFDAYPVELTERLFNLADLRQADLASRTLYMNRLDSEDLEPWQANNFEVLARRQSDHADNALSTINYELRKFDRRQKIAKLMAKFSLGFLAGAGRDNSAAQTFPAGIDDGRLAGGHGADFFGQIGRPDIT